jgi:hypothetical protein
MGYDIIIPKESITQLPPQDAVKQVILGINEAGCPLGSPLTEESPLPPGCTVYINKEPVPADQLTERTTTIYTNRAPADRVLFLAAEEHLNYELVVRILGMARAGAGDDLKVGIVTDEKLARGEATEVAGVAAIPLLN